MPIQGLNFVIPNNTEKHQSYQATGSFIVYNPNDGVCFVATDRAATTVSWDYKIPSQSGGKFPGPINSYLSIYYQDQSGSATTGQVIVYASTDKMDIPHFWSIGRALLAAGSTLDINTGTQPTNPPANTVRLWVDGVGDLHILSPSGVDNLVYDSSNIGTVTLGGDLQGTINNGTVVVRNSSNIAARDSANNPHTYVSFGAETLWWESQNNRFRWVNQSNSTEWMQLNSAGLYVAGDGRVGGQFTIWGSYLWFGGNNTSYILVTGDQMYLRPHSGAVNIQTDSGAWGSLSTGPLSVNSNLVAAGYIVAGTSLSANGGYIYFRSDNGIILHWDGTYFQFNAAISTIGYCNAQQFNGYSPSNGSAAGNYTLAMNLNNSQGNNCMFNVWWYRQVAGASWPSEALIFAYDVDSPFNRVGGWLAFYGGNCGISMVPTGGQRLQVAGDIYTSTGTLTLLGANLTYNGSYVNFSHSIQFNTTGNQIVWPNGSYISGNAGYAQGSKREQKQNIVAVGDHRLANQVVDPRLNVYSFEWKEDGKRGLGFMLDEMEQVLPAYVVKDEETGESVAYSIQELTAILWGAVRDTINRVQKLETV